MQDVWLQVFRVEATQLGSFLGDVQEMGWVTDSLECTNCVAPNMMCPKKGGLSLLLLSPQTLNPVPVLVVTVYCMCGSPGHVAARWFAVSGRT